MMIEQTVSTIVVIKLHLIAISTHFGQEDIWITQWSWQKRC